MIQQLIEWMEKEVRSYQGIMESTGNSNQLIALSNKINTIRKAISKAKELQATEQCKWAVVEEDCGCKSNQSCTKHFNQQVESEP
jgi:hypothetical protein